MITYVKYIFYAKARTQTLSMNFIGSIYSFKYDFSNKTNCEHIIPRSRFIKFENLKVLKYDLHNLYPCCVYLNSQRKNHKYTDELGESNLILLDTSLCFERPKFHFIPPLYAKGKIARICLFYIEKYPELKNTILENVLDKELLIKWHDTYKPDEQELKRDWLIGNIQGDSNKFILYPEKIDNLDL